MREALRRLMKDEIEETLDKATKEASEQGRTQMQKEISEALSKMGMSVKNIVSAVSASVEQVLEWI